MRGLQWLLWLPPVALPEEERAALVEDDDPGEIHAQHGGDRHGEGIEEGPGLSSRVVSGETFFVSASRAEGS